MAADFRKFDEQGFPLPPNFEPLQYQDEQTPQRRTISMRTKRLVLLGVAIAFIVPVVFGPRLAAIGRETVSRWWSSRAERKYLQGDPRGALADLTHAIEWNPKAWSLYGKRAAWRFGTNDFEGSLADWNQFINLVPQQDVPRRDRRNWRQTWNRTELMLNAYTQRSQVLLRLGRHRDSIDDATRAVQLNPSPQMLNLRAYARALGNLELAEGLEDVQRAITDSGQENADYLDTRGYLLHLLNRNDDALRDLNRAIEIVEVEGVDDIADPQPQFAFNQQRVQRDQRRTDESLAVMYHHRALVLKQLGRQAEADENLRRGDELGYDPANGVL